MSSNVSLIDQLDPLFNPRSVAVIGATNVWNKWGFSTFSSILNGFKGKVYPINKNESEVIGHKAYAKVTDIPEDEPLDLVVFVIPAPAIPPVMEECVEKGVKAAVVISAGFAETGDEGKKLQDEVLRIARKGSIRFIGPNCMGFWSATSELRAFMFPLPVEPGPIAFVSQGGNVGGTVMQMGYERGLGFRRYVSCGCAADIQIEDYIEHFGADPEVKVILAYVEGLVDGQRFIDKVRPITAKKPVIVMKPGKTEAGSKAISSHSGALAGSSEIYDHAFRKSGVIRVSTASALLDVAIGFLTQPLPQGENMAIITPGGSYGVISADACASLGLNVITLSPETIAEFDKIFPPRWSRGNPVDPAGDRNFIAYMQAPDLLLKLPEVHSMIFMGFDSFSSFGSVFTTLSEELAQTFRDFFKDISSVVPREDLRNGDNGHGWMEELIRKIVKIFFSFFGTSTPSEVESFVRKQVSFTGSKEVLVSLRKRLLNTLKTIEKGDSSDIGYLFEQLFNPLLEALVRNWIASYKKPVITTSFMGASAALTEMNHYAFPFAEHAAFVLAKLLEYKRYLDGEKLMESND
ncbi:MAG: CoA-binding protein [Desulfatiglans sp.]|jgi:acyl-CoA synthetase (NDP forming)|nr:CoA-binding protein [Thermodesulfobacteriota bacterium]MEE4353388.1 CoA-binding protein [Desulfatiglans sp.]